MSTYRFDTTVTMKPYNAKKWWIDAGIVRPITVVAESMDEAIDAYAEKARQYGIHISKNARKEKQPMYVDKGNEPQQIGFVFTGSSDFYTEYPHRAIKQYVEVWTTINMVVNPFEA